MRIAARCALVGMIAVGLVGSKDWLSDKIDAYHTEPEMVFRAIGEDVFVRCFPPEEDSSISGSHFFNISEGNGYWGGRYFLPRSQINRGLLGYYPFALGEIGLGFLFKPFNGNPEVHADSRRRPIVLPYNADIQSSRFAQVGEAVLAGLESLIGGDLGLADISSQLDVAGTDLLGNGFVGAMQIIAVLWRNRHKPKAGINPTFAECGGSYDGI